MHVATNIGQSSQLTDWAEYKSIQGQVCQSVHIEHQNYIAKILNFSCSLNGNISNFERKIKLELAHYRLLKE